VGRKAWGGDGEICAIDFREVDAPVEKHRLITRKIIFIVPPGYPRVPKVGGQCPPTLLGCAAHD